jgi:hypothetical protein
VKLQWGEDPRLVKFFSKFEVLGPPRHGHGHGKEQECLQCNHTETNMRVTNQLTKRWASYRANYLKR